MAKIPHKPKVAVEIRTGAEGRPPTKYTYGIASIKGENGWEVHPAWAKQPKCSEFLIELCSNDPRFLFQSHLSCYRPEHQKGDGPKKVSAFCFRAHRGNDLPGVALRKPKQGGMVQVECDPGVCDLFQQYCHGGHDKLIKALYPDLYGGKFTVDDAGTVLTCKPNNALLFRLLLPDGSGYAHHELEIAMITTHSNTTHDRFKSEIEKLLIETGGRMAGLRMKLVYDPFVTKHSKKPQSAWNLIPPDMTLDEMKAGAAERTKLVDYEASDEQSTDLVKVNEETNIALHLKHDFPALQAAATDYIHKESVSAQIIDPSTVTLINQHPTVKLLAERLGTPYAKQVAMPILFGTNVLKALEWLLKHAESQDAFVDDIMLDSPFAKWFEKRKVQPVVVEPEPVSRKEREGEVEAEFTEIQDDDDGPGPDVKLRSTEEILAAAKGRVTTTEEEDANPRQE